MELVDKEHVNLKSLWVDPMPDVLVAAHGDCHAIANREIYTADENIMHRMVEQQDNSLVVMQMPCPEHGLSSPLQFMEYEVCCQLVQESVPHLHNKFEQIVCMTAQGQFENQNEFPSSDSYRWPLNLCKNCSGIEKLEFQILVTHNNRGIDTWFTTRHKYVSRIIPG